MFRPNDLNDAPLHICKCGHFKDKHDYLGCSHAGSFERFTGLVISCPCPEYYEKW